MKDTYVSFASFLLSKSKRSEGEEKAASAKALVLSVADVGNAQDFIPSRDRMHHLKLHTSTSLFSSIRVSRQFRVRKLASMCFQPSRETGSSTRALRLSRNRQLDIAKDEQRNA